MEERVKLDIFLRNLLNVSNYYSLYPESKKDLPVFKFFEPIAKVKTRYNKEDLVDFVSVKIPDSKALINKGSKASLKDLEDYIIESTSITGVPSGIYFAHYLLPEISFELLLFVIESFFLFYKKEYPDKESVIGLAKIVLEDYRMLSEVVKSDVIKSGIVHNKIMDINYIIKNIDEK